MVEYWAEQTAVVWVVDSADMSGAPKVVQWVDQKAEWKVGWLDADLVGLKD